MKRIICLILALLMLVFTLTACNSKDKGEETETRIAPKADEIDMSEIDSLDGVTESAEPTDYVMIKVEDYGDIVIRLYPEVAPASVANFKKLVSEKFYDGLTFHRVISGFMIQGGDPKGNGMGNSSENVVGEFSSNGFENNLHHRRGVVAMARSNDPNSASCQFYICHKNSQVAQLDGSYASFGYVIYGIEVVDKIAKVNTDSNDKPLKDVVMSSIRFVTVD